jgi:hypothetical protein
MNVATFNFDLFWRVVVILLGMVVYGVLYARASQKLRDLRADAQQLRETVNGVCDYLQWQFGEPENGEPALVPKRVAEASTEEIPPVLDETTEMPKPDLVGGARITTVSKTFDLGHGDAPSFRFRKPVDLTKRKAS